MANSIAINSYLLSLAIWSTLLMSQSWAVLTVMAFISSNTYTYNSIYYYTHKATCFRKSSSTKQPSYNYRYATVKTSTAAENEQDCLGMTPELKRVTEAFAAIQEEQIRYKQLLYMAQTTEEANNLSESSKIPENKVPGCLSTVYVDGTATYSDEIQDYVINLQGDSDGLMTKGLVALLVRCLSGNTAESIQNVDPKFIKIARIDQSLTPGRNNGFLNMLESMKNKALSLDEAARKKGTTDAAAAATAANNTDTFSTSNLDAHDGKEANESGVNGPKYEAIVHALQAIKPKSLELVDNSRLYDTGGKKESHFELLIVAPAFEQLNAIKRQQLIYMMLGELMPQIESLQITALTPDEAK